jgi:hypothetical protein
VRIHKSAGTGLFPVAEGTFSSGKGTDSDTATRFPVQGRQPDFVYLYISKFSILLHDVVLRQEFTNFWNEVSVKAIILGAVLNYC